MNKHIMNFLSNMPKPRIKAEGNVLSIYGTIGNWFEECDAKSVIDMIDSIEGDITVRLNSPGGDVFDGMAIMNALKNHNGKVTVIVEGLAASAASYIAIGGADELHMLEGSMLMIHNALSLVLGNAADMRKEAELLDKISEQIANIYAKRCKKNIEDVKASMDIETWFTASEAKDYGFNVIDDEDEASIENFALLKTFNNVPDKFNIAPAAKPQNKRDLEALLHRNGFSRNEAKAIASKAFINQCDAGEITNEKLEALEKAISERNNLFK